MGADLVVAARQGPWLPGTGTDAELAEQDRADITGAQAFARSLTRHQSTREVLKPRLTEFIPHHPTPKQQAFLLLPHREALYGGAAGGGKSDALLMAALQYVDIPGYAALILRRTVKQLELEGGLLERAGKWLGPTRAIAKDGGKKWVFPSGAVLQFGYLDGPWDHENYQGTNWHFVGFDELTQFEEKKYRYLFSRLRRAKESEIPVRMRAASNPGGKGHDWVKQRFLIEGVEKRRIFIPAGLQDNPHLDREDYIQGLMELDPVTRGQLLRGDWDIREKGGVFDRSWFGVPLSAIPGDIRLVRAWDLAGTEPKPGKDPDYSVGALVGQTTRDMKYVVCDIQRFRKSPGGVEDHVRQTASIDGTGVPIWMEQEPGQSGKSQMEHYQRRILQGYTFHAEPPTGDKLVRAGPWSSQAEAGNFRVVGGPWLGAFLDEIEGFPQGSHDDQVDAVSLGFNKLALRRTPRIRRVR